MKVFVDSSVWFAAALSPSGGLSESLQRLVSQKIPVLVVKQVIAETVRNLQTKGTPTATERFLELYASVQPTVVELNKDQISQAGAVINEKDAPILAGAKVGDCQFLVTLDRRHFLEEKVIYFARPTEIGLPRDLLDGIPRV
ncbi:MAG: PIN domain-containing protein [Candidatus Berkelbacteria bacterium]|nr:PIN domain-containing protein [Candidatus Berkelbacteria bacterium]MCR4307193.1 PIN domain-containing protein [Candidatus Berkelbacteria bacterium]